MIEKVAREAADRGKEIRKTTGENEKRGRAKQSEIDEE